MAKKSVSQILREVKKAKARETQKLAKHLELMGAAYCRATDIPPAEVTLMSETLKDGTRRYWYARFDTRPDLNECHPDIRRLFEIGTEIARAKATGSPSDVEVGVQVLVDFINYIGKEAEKDDLKAVRDAQKEAEAGQDASDNNQGQEEIRVSGIE